MWDKYWLIANNYSFVWGRLQHLKFWSFWVILKKQVKNFVNNLPFWNLNNSFPLDFQLGLSGAFGSPASLLSGDVLISHVSRKIWLILTWRFQIWHQILRILFRLEVIDFEFFLVMVDFVNPSFNFLFQQNDKAVWTEILVADNSNFCLLLKF